RRAAIALLAVARMPGLANPSLSATLNAGRASGKGVDQRFPMVEPCGAREAVVHARYRRALWRRGIRAAAARRREAIAKHWKEGKGVRCTTPGPFPAPDLLRKSTYRSLGILTTSERSLFWSRVAAVFLRP